MKEVQGSTVLSKLGRLQDEYGCLPPRETINSAYLPSDYQRNYAQT